MALGGIPLSQLDNVERMVGGEGRGANGGHGVSSIPGGQTGGPAENRHSGSHLSHMGHQSRATSAPPAAWNPHSISQQQIHRHPQFRGQERAGTLPAQGIHTLLLTFDDIFHCFL